MGSHVGKIIYYKPLKSQEDEENGVVSDHDSDSSDEGDLRKVAAELPTWKAIANITSFVQRVVLLKRTTFYEMGSHVGKIIYYKTLKSQEDEENGVVSDHDSDSSDEGDLRKVAAELPMWKAIANITSFVQGVGILALPYAVLKGGLATVIGFPLFAVIHWYTGKVMVDCMYDDGEGGGGEEEEEEEEEEDNKDEEEISEKTLLGIDNNKQTPASTKFRVRNLYSDLGEVLWPQYGSVLLDVLQSIDLLILAISYLILCGSLLANALPMAGLTESSWASIVAVVVLPSTFVKDFACVAWQSLLGVISLITMVSVLLWYAINHSSAIKFQNVLFWDTEGALVAVGLILQSYCVYSILLPIEESMADRSKFRSAFGISLLFAATFKVIFALFGFLSFLHETDEVIGNNFPFGTPRTLVTIVYVMYIVFSYTLVVYPVFQSIDESRLSLTVAPYIPWLIWTAITRLSVVFLMSLIAVFVPHYALLTSFVGCLWLPFLEYIVPCWIHLKLKWSSLKPLQIAADGLVIIMAVFFTVFGVYFSGKVLVAAMSKQ